MKYINKVLLLLLAVVFSGQQACANESKQPGVAFSGFGRLVAGILDDKDASYEGYDNSLSISEGSLLGLQVDAQLSPEWSLTAQAIAHSSDTQDSGLEWLYLSYQPSNALRIKAGKMRTPFFSYSDVIDVGYAYHFLNPPQQIYGTYFFDTFEGISANYNVSQSFFDAEVDLYYGRFEDKVNAVTYDVDTEVENIQGIALNLRKDNLKFRISAHKGDADVAFPEVTAFADILKQANYLRSAETLATSGEVKAYQISLNYDAIDYFVHSEFIRFTSPIVLYPEVDAYYLSYGYIFYPFTAHITYANTSTTIDQPAAEIPLGLTPEVDALAAGYKNVFTSFRENQDNLESLALGVRWDFTLGMAAKAEWTHLRGTPGMRSYFNIHQAETFDHRANLFQVALEWVF